MHSVDDHEFAGLFKKLKKTIKKVGKKIDPVTVTKKSFKETKRAVNNPAVKKGAAVVASAAAIYFSGGAAAPAVLAAWKLDADKRAAKKAAKAGDQMPTYPPDYVVDELEKGAGYPVGWPSESSYSAGGGGGGGVLGTGSKTGTLLVAGGVAIAAYYMFKGK